MTFKVVAGRSDRKRTKAEIVQKRACVAPRTRKSHSFFGVCEDERGWRHRVMADAGAGDIEIKWGGSGRAFKPGSDARSQWTLSQAKGPKCGCEGGMNWQPREAEKKNISKVTGRIKGRRGGKGREQVGEHALSES